MTPLGILMNTILEIFLKINLKLSQAKVARKKDLRGLLTSRNMIPKSFGRSSRKIKKLEEIRIPYLEMPESTLKMFRKNRRKGEF